MKTKIPSLSYNAMFKAVFSNNKVILSKLVQAILEYYKIDIDVKDKELIIRNNELLLDNYRDKQLICDYIIKLDDDTDLNIEINKSNYIGLTERNMTYSFKIFYEHFKTGDDYKEFHKYTLLQVNFNHFSNYNDKTINRYYMLNMDDITNKLSNSFSIMNIDIEKCFSIVYNSSNLEEISDLEKWSAIIACEYLEDIASILESGLLSMEEKEEFLSDIKEKSKDKDVLEGIKFESSIDYRFELVEEDAYNRGIEQGIEQKAVDIINAMLAKKIPYEDISEISGKSIDEIKEIEKSKDIDVLDVTKLEDSNDYRVKAIEEYAYERGIEQGNEQTKIDMIKSMLENKVAYEVISKVSGKSIEEIKEIEKSMKD